MDKIKIKQEIGRLKKYLELVNRSFTSSTGALQEFWGREIKRTSSRLARLES